MLRTTRLAKQYSLFNFLNTVAYFVQAHCENYVQCPLGRCQTKILCLGKLSPARKIFSPAQKKIDTRPLGVKIHLYLSKRKSPAQNTNHPPTGRGIAPLLMKKNSTFHKNCIFQNFSNWVYCNLKVLLKCLLTYYFFA